MEEQEIKENKHQSTDKQVGVKPQDGLEQAVNQNEQQKQAEGQHDNKRVDESKHLKEQLQACQTECSSWKDKFIHVSADFQNFKKRVEKEQRQWAHHAQADLLVQLLAITDDFDRALAEHRKRERTPELDAWLEGFEIIGKSLYKFLQQCRVKEIEQMQTFDPHLHEAIVQVESVDHQSGQIVDVVQKGFIFKDEVLRPAKVTVAK